MTQVELGIDQYDENNKDDSEWNEAFINASEMDSVCTKANQ